MEEKQKGYETDSSGCSDESNAKYQTRIKKDKEYKRS